MNRVYVRRPGDGGASGDVIFEPGANLHTGEEDFATAFGSPTSLESDLLILSAAVFAADRCIAREPRQHPTRGIELSVPVVNAARLVSLVPRIERVLRKLSLDAWRLQLRQVGGTPEPDWTGQESTGQTLLFSGGLDSLAAALEFSASEQLQLVSHNTRNQPTRAAQQALIEALQSAGRTFAVRHFFVSSRSAPPASQVQHDIENTQRTRSFMFLLLGALSARRMGHRSVLMLAENGQMAIHLALTPARIGPFSTYTAHPDVLAMMEGILSEALGYSITVRNPYVESTKAEVIGPIVRDLPAAIALSTSCWKNTRLSTGATHCGLCIPCLVRRIAVEAHWAQDPTSYQDDIFAVPLADLPEEHEGRRNLADYAEFVLDFERESASSLIEKWPELRSRNFNSSAVIAMYKRAAVEARTMMSRYPVGAGLLA